MGHFENTIRDAEARAKARKVSKQQIDAETWAESGGTAGIFGKLHRAGKLEIVDSDEQIVPTL